jgi:hypothetical protein
MRSPQAALLRSPRGEGRGLLPVISINLQLCECTPLKAEPPAPVEPSGDVRLTSERQSPKRSSGQGTSYV